MNIFYDLIMQCQCLLYTVCAMLLPKLLYWLVDRWLAANCYKRFPHIVKKLLKNSSADRDVMRNYRLISNLSFLSKVIDKCVYSQVMQHLMSNDLLGHFQSAYRPYHSCETALMMIHNDIGSMLDAKLNVVLLVFDLSAAFDTVNHNILLEKLGQQYGLTDTVFAWFESYLSSRKYYVKVNNSSSHDVSVSSGVPPRVYFRPTAI